MKTCVGRGWQPAKETRCTCSRRPIGRESRRRWRPSDCSRTCSPPQYAISDNEFTRRDAARLDADQQACFKTELTYVFVELKLVAPKPLLALFLLLFLLLLLLLLLLLVRQRRFASLSRASPPVWLLTQAADYYFASLGRAPMEFDANSASKRNRRAPAATADLLAIFLEVTRARAARPRDFSLHLRAALSWPAALFLRGQFESVARTHSRWLRLKLGTGAALLWLWRPEFAHRRTLVAIFVARDSATPGGRTLSNASASPPHNSI